jgi:ribosomal protein L4
LDYDSKDYSENYNKTACLQDKILDEESKFSNKKLSKNASEEMKEQIDPVNILSQQNVLLEKKADVYEKRIEELTKALAKFEEK